jgi:hypothetical protein
MVKIYCIEDINDLKYVGKTTQKLRARFNSHLSRKYNKSPNYSSRFLHLEHSIIYLLEECEKEVSKEREQYWINKLQSVNQNSALTFSWSEYRDKNREHIRNYSRVKGIEYRKNKGIIPQTNTSGHKNIYWHKSEKKWVFRMRGRYKIFKRFNSKIDCICYKFYYLLKINYNNKKFDS